MGPSEWIAVVAVAVSVVALAAAWRANQVAAEAEKRATEAHDVEWTAVLDGPSVRVWNVGLDRATEVRWRMLLGGGHVGMDSGTAGTVEPDGEFSVSIYELLKTVSGVKTMDYEMFISWRSPAGNPNRAVLNGSGSTEVERAW